MLCRLSQWMALSAALVFMSGCGNPFAGNDENKKAHNAFHTTTPSCNAINLASETIDSKQLLAILDCLNSNQEIDALSRLIHDLHPNEKNTVAETLNFFIHDQTNLYALKETYSRLKKSGDLNELLAWVKLLTQNKGLNAQAAKAIQKITPSLTDLIQDENFKINFAHASQLGQSPSFERLIRQHHSSDFLSRLATLVVQYRKTNDSLSLVELYDLLSTPGLKEGFVSLIERNSKTRIESLASFLEYLFSSGGFDKISLAVEELQNQKLTCFGAKVPIESPLKAALSSLSNREASRVANAVNSEFKSLLLLARGHCEINYSFESFFQFMDEATKHPGFTELFELLRPVLNDPEGNEKFIRWVSSRAARELVRNGAFLADHHFFQDLTTLIAQSQINALSSNGRRVAVALDSSLLQLSSFEIQSLAEFLSPLFRPENNYGKNFLRLLDRLSIKVPQSLKISDELRPQIARSFSIVFSQNQLGEVLSLFHTLIHENRLVPLIDQTIQIFSRFLEKGKHTLVMRSSIDFEKIKSIGPNEWLLNKKAPPKRDPRDSICDRVTRFSFDRFDRRYIKNYLADLDLIEACVSDSGTYRALKKLAILSIEKGKMESLLRVESAFLSSVFSKSRELPLFTVQSFLDSPRDDLTVVKQGLLTSSAFLRTVSQTKSPALTTHNESKKFFATLVQDPFWYRLTSRWLSQDITPDVVVPAYLPFKSIDVQVSRSEFKSKISMIEALDLLMDEYCPTRRVQDGSCEVDDDQVELYLKSKNQLAQKMIEEYLGSSQSWAHPLEFKSWSRSDSPQKFTQKSVGDFDYHFNPAINLIRQSPEVPKSVLNAVQLIRSHQFDLKLFLKERARRLTVIPYIFQNTQYPLQSKEEFTPRIRFRIVSDLDRLELLSINADFKAFGLMQNMGLGFIRDIGLSWGDLPESQRPKNLSVLSGGMRIRTLSETRNYIFSEMQRFDRGLIQSLGSCDTRGRGAVGRWVRRNFCSAGLSDISSRLFNLRFLLPLLDRELEDINQPSGGLALLRDLFFSLYQANTVNQFDRFSSGVDLPYSCFVSPIDQNEVPSECVLDNLTLVSRITRLGLLHQASLAYLDSDSDTASAMLVLLQKISEDDSAKNSFSNLLSSVAGARLLNDGVGLGFKLGTTANARISELIQISAFTEDTRWLSAFSQLLSDTPHFIHDYQNLITQLLIGDARSLYTFKSIFKNEPAETRKNSVHRLAHSLTPELIKEWAEILNLAKPQSEALANSWKEFAQTPKFKNQTVLKSVGLWVDLYSKDNALADRKKFANWLLSRESGEFCDAYSDADWINATYNFLDQLHQNPDSRTFFDTVETFLKHK